MFYCILKVIHGIFCDEYKGLLNFIWPVWDDHIWKWGEKKMYVYVNIHVWIDPVCSSSQACVQENWKISSNLLNGSNELLCKIELANLQNENFSCTETLQFRSNR